jgi:hypothetical protein
MCKISFCCRGIVTPARETNVAKAQSLNGVGPDHIWSIAESVPRGLRVFEPDAVEMAAASCGGGAHSLNIPCKTLPAGN